MTDQSGSMTFGYDARGRLVNKTSIINNQTYSVLRSYTPGGRISSTTSPTGRTMDYDRTTCACKVDAVSTTYNGTTISLANNLSYRPFGIATGMNTGAGGTVNNTFDQSGCLTVANPGTDKERTYTYDNNGNLTSVTAPNTPWYNRAYTYDALNRLNHAEGPYGSIDYTYDNVGNRLTKVAGGQTETYTYTPGTNRLQEVTGTDTILYTHDANGNITGIGDKVLTYNQNNRLVMVEDNSGTLGEYTYNGLGQRVVKTANGITTIFHYDFNGNIIGESDIDGNFTKEYLYRGKGRSAMVDVASGEMYYYGNDRLGTPQILTDSTNTVVWEGYYKPFGEAEVNPNSSVVNNFRFAGQYYDEETGLHYNWHRYYDPRMGRYLRADPIGVLGGINLFLYAENNPINLIDFYGLEVLNPNNYPISPEVSKTLEQFNEYIGNDKDIVITGGNRPPDTDIGSGKQSTHVRGIAADIKVPGQPHLKTANQAAESGLFGGVGWYEEGYYDPRTKAGPHVHVDLREGTARWGYDKYGRYYKGYFPKYEEDPCE
jgi:RHS repeat-associated protein